MMDEATLDVLHGGYENYCRQKGYLSHATKAEIRVWEEYRGKVYMLIHNAAEGLRASSGRTNRKARVAK